MLAAAAAKDDSARKRAKYSSPTTCESIPSTQAYWQPSDIQQVEGLPVIAARCI